MTRTTHHSSEVFCRILSAWPPTLTAKRPKPNGCSSSKTRLPSGRCWRLSSPACRALWSSARQEVWTRHSRWPRRPSRTWWCSTGCSWEVWGSSSYAQCESTPPPYVLVFSANTTDLAVREALGNGARGYIEKTASFNEFTKALKSIAEGQSYLGPTVARSVRRIVSNPERVEANSTLSAREREVLRFLAEGMSSKEIASHLGLSVRTVENHRAHIVKRTGLRSIAQLTLHAVRLGLVEVPAAEASLGGAG